MSAPFESVHDLRRKTILVVDDSADNLTVLGNLLLPDHHVRVANSGLRGLQVATTPPRPDLILLDVMMPGMDGYAVLKELKSDRLTRDIPVIFVTALDDPEEQTFGLQLGAVDYITKPFNGQIVRARVRAQLTLKQAHDGLVEQNQALQEEVTRRTDENSHIQEVTLNALESLARFRDPETGNHLTRTQCFVAALARRLSKDIRYATVLNEETIELLVRSAPLHDIGKVGIPDNILRKPSELTADEWRVMKTHALLGAQAIEQAEHDARWPAKFLHMAKEIAHYHHEKWDGSGYPDGLAGLAIPLPARLMAVADVFDALSTPRVYKPALSHDEAFEAIVANRGRHFDPDVIQAFIEVFEEIKAIARRFSDNVQYGREAADRPPGSAARF